VTGSRVLYIIIDTCLNFTTEVTLMLQLTLLVYSPYLPVSFASPFYIICEETLTR